MYDYLQIDSGCVWTTSRIPQKRVSYIPKKRVQCSQSSLLPVEDIIGASEREQLWWPSALSLISSWYFPCFSACLVEGWRLISWGHSTSCFSWNCLFSLLTSLFTAGFEKDMPGSGWLQNYVSLKAVTSLSSVSPEVINTHTHTALATTRQKNMWAALTINFEVNIMLQDHPRSPQVASLRPRV